MADKDEKIRVAKVSKLILQSENGNIETIVDGEPQAEPAYCRKCGGMTNLYDVFPKYDGPPSLYGCHCP